MTKARRLSLAVTVLLCAGIAVPVLAQQPPPPQPSSAITGTVSAPDGALLPGAAVLVFDDDGREARRVVTDDRGGYRASRLAAGCYRIVVRLDGFATRAADSVCVQAASVRTLNLSLALSTVKEAVTVIGSAPVDSFEATKVRESGARDLGEALADVPGVSKIRRAAIANEPIVRGYQGENIDVLIDGTRLYGACPNNMDHAAFHVDFAEVDRVEIAKGPFDVRNQGGLGGVVNVVTRPPAAGFHLSPTVSTGSFGYVNPSTTISYGTPAIAALAGYSYRSSGPYVDGSGRRFTDYANYRASARDLDAFRIHTGWGRADFTPRQNHSFRASYTAQRAGLVTYPYLMMDATSDSADRATVAYAVDRPGAAVERLRVQGYWNRVVHDMTDQYRTSSATSSRAYSMATFARTDTRGVKAELGVRALTAGFEFYRRWWDASTVMGGMAYLPQASIPDVTTNAAGAYVEYSRALSNAVSLDLGGRFDDARIAANLAKAPTSLYAAYHQTRATSASDRHPSAKARLSWRIAEALTITGGLGRTARVPDPQEQFFGLKRAGTDWVGNPLLKAPTNTGLEVSATYRRERLSLNASAYRDWLGNFIALYEQARVGTVAGVMNQVARSYTNVDAAMIGFEADATVTLHDRLFLALDASSVRGQRDAVPAIGLTGRNLAEMPPAKGRARVRYETAGDRRGWFAEIETVVAARQDRVDASVGERPTAGYSVFNARSGFGYRRMRIVIGLANLFDRYYSEYLSYQRDPFRSGAIVPEPGRNVYVTVALKF